MSSWVKCRCGSNVHKNIFAGENVSFIVSDDFLDRELSETSADSLVRDMVAKCKTLLRCKKCGRMIVVDDRGNAPHEFFAPEAE